MKSKNKVFSLSDVSLHNNSKDCWVAINARVYDVTNFLNDHPGGDNVLLDVAGKDASEEFEEVGHGSAARLMLDEYYVGEVDHISTTPKAGSHLKQETIIQEDKLAGISSTIKSVGFIFPLAIFGVAIGFMLNK
ncbi:cytochrome b5, heme-binding site-containing protein [Artemisia annua]|uniref:Cytochrome b5, heme-binding site-containing protein n=1 Tax=Artemisia annua TaxID=35608 RepID=A0A2U1LZX2_ARTAN|nr:cytochrome b5, heme-binding site-containing protein [Artemisia annua]